MENVITINAEEMFAHGAEPSWALHIEFDNLDYAPFLNTHTHGIREQFGHPDFQVVLPYPPDEASYMLNAIGIAVSMGKSFKDGDYIDGLTSCRVRLIERQESDRNVLRLIMPDKNGRWPEDPLCDILIRRQADDMFTEIHPEEEYIYPSDCDSCEKRFECESYNGGEEKDPALNGGLKTFAGAPRTHWNRAARKQARSGQEEESAESYFME